jgi:hypothetical protein
VAAGLVALLLCAVTALPGVVDEGDLDARPVNALPAIGVVIVLGLTAAAVWRHGFGDRRPWSAGDAVCGAVIAILLAVSLPWILAAVGLYADDVPLLGDIVLSTERPPGEALPAVHLGHHHGLDGALLATSALILGRGLGDVRPRWLAGVLAWYLALMVAYGVGNVANDAWLEQVVKRGWTDWQIPNVLRPQLSLAWALVLLGAVVLRILVFRPHGDRPG